MDTKKVDIQFEISEKDKQILIDRSLNKPITRATIISVPGFSLAKISMEDIINGRAKVWVLESKYVDESRRNTHFFAVKGLKIETFSTKSKPGYVTINGVLDVPVETKGTIAIDKAVFLDYKQAAHYAKVLTAMEYERIDELIMGYEEDRVFLRDQLKTGRF